MDELIEIVRAQPEDAQKLTEIAMAAKRHWGYPENWMVKWQEVLTISPDSVSANTVYKALWDGELIGFYVLIFTHEKLELKHMWVHPDKIGHGTGKRLMAHVIHQAALTDHENMEIESDPNAVDFFKKMGARSVGARIYKLEGSKRILPLLYLNIPRALEKLGGA
ncbi:MAG: GNAT family N-acetyltransferase [Anaerolineaceae bacterium]|jgi:GNAT superfamily N-acetyltransferase|nr:GNAT family N-acetyltransferase [Anaerolineaceae bacterium]